TANAAAAEAAGGSAASFWPAVVFPLAVCLTRAAASDQRETPSGPRSPIGCGAAQTGRSTSSPRVRSRSEVLCTPDAGIDETGEVDGHELGCPAPPGLGELGPPEGVTPPPI